MFVSRTIAGRPLILALVLLATANILVAGCASSSGPVSPEELEEVAQGIDKSLMCPVCPSETIDQSQTEIAKQMRSMVRERLAQGDSREKVLQFFVDRYGVGILAEPPKQGVNLLVWVVPPLALVVGSSILAMTIKAMRKGRGEAVEQVLPLPEAELEPYLSAVDQEIGRITSTGGAWTRSDDSASAGSAHVPSAGSGQALRQAQDERNEKAQRAKAEQ